MVKIFLLMYVGRPSNRKQTTGHTPYYLLYRKHHMFPFNITDGSWYMLNWSTIHTTEDLLAICRVQLAHQDEDIKAASDELLQSRI
jgi:hypothetical protein